MILQLLAALLIMFTTHSYNGHLNRPKNAPYYREMEIRIKADSLLDNWMEETIKRDTL